MAISLLLVSVPPSHARFAFEAGRAAFENRASREAVVLAVTGAAAAAVASVVVAVGAIALLSCTVDSSQFRVRE